MLILAKALGVLPRKVLIVGCQPKEYEDLGIGLSEPVMNAVARVSELFGAIGAAVDERE